MQKKILLFFTVFSTYGLSPLLYAGNGAGWFFGGAAAGALTATAISKARNKRSSYEYSQPRYVEVQTIDRTDRGETEQLKNRLNQQEMEYRRRFDEQERKIKHLKKKQIKEKEKYSDQVDKKKNTSLSTQEEIEILKDDLQKKQAQIDQLERKLLETPATEPSQ